MARAKRNKSYRPAKIHDRRSRDLPRNAEVAEVEVDNPLALEPGEKIVALRSIRNDPLGRLHSHRQIDEPAELPIFLRVDLASKRERLVAGPAHHGRIDAAMAPLRGPLRPHNRLTRGPPAVA